MDLTDTQFTSLLKGKRIKLTLRNSAFTGVVQRINPNKSVVLADVHDTNGRRIQGTKLFFGRDIIDVAFETEANLGCGDSRQLGLEEQLTVKKFQPYRKITALYGEDEKEDEGEYIDFVVIDEFLDKFGSTVMKIKKQHLIGVASEGIEMYKNGRLCWLQIAVKNKVYLFDILRLGARAFKNGLAMILESKHILKVMHDCRTIAGCLSAQFGVTLTNVFDTQVADVICFRSQTGGFLPSTVSTLEQVVHLHLKVPSSQLSSLQMKSSLTKEEEEVWYLRPCPVALLKVMALSVVHLLPLRLVLLDALMTDYMTAVDSYLSSSCYQPDELEQVSMESLLELPRELRQLDQMYRDRHEWAAAHYPVTQQGLLVRFAARPQASSRASPAAENEASVQPGATVAETEEPQPSPEKEPVCQPTASPPTVAVVAASPNPEAHDAARCGVSDLRAHVGPLPGEVDRPHREGMMGLRLSLREEDSCGPPLPSAGRGFLLHMLPASIPAEGAEDTRALSGTETAPAAPGRSLARGTSPQLGRRSYLPKELCASRKEPLAPGPQSGSSSLAQSFRAFRY